MPVVHGWRMYSLSYCRKHKAPTLRGMYGMHVHQAESPRAECRGFNRSAIWVNEYKEHPASEVPGFSCSCGFYGYRLFPQSGLTPPTNIVAHVTALGETVIHKEGFRTSRYKLDYIIPPPLITVGLPWGDAWEVRDLPETLTEIVEEIGVPVLPFDHPDACQICLEVNKEAEREPNWKTAFCHDEHPST